MFPQQTASGRFQDCPTGLPVIHVDHGLVDVAYPTSPSSQFMYEADTLDCSAIGIPNSCHQMASSASTSSIISPSVEGMTFDEMFSITGLCDEDDSWFVTEKDMFDLVKMEDAFVGNADLGTDPTLTQLNSDDLESTLLDDFNGGLYQSTPLFDPEYFKIMKMKEVKAYSCGVNKNALAPASPSVMFSCGTPKANSLGTKYTTCTITSTTPTSPATSLPKLCAIPTAGNYPYPSTSAMMPVKVEPDVTPIPQPMLIGQIGTPAVCLSTNSNLGFGVVAERSVPLQYVLPANHGVYQGVTSPVRGILPMELLSRGGAVIGNDLVTSSVAETGRMCGSNLDEKWSEIEDFLQSAAANSRSFETLGTMSSGRLGAKIKLEKSADVAYGSLSKKTEEEEGSVDSDLNDSDAENASDDDAASDADSVESHPTDVVTEFLVTGRKPEKRFFWQYNTQSKGPKGKRLCKTMDPQDPHVLHDFEDPVFDPEQSTTRYKHNGKARRGDGNDVTPNPYKLFVTGNELKKLNKLINSMMPPSELPAPVRSRTLKEKNKYASRACRLKKKAQHEANKIKLHGLEHEHRQLMKVLECIKKDIVVRLSGSEHSDREPVTSKLDDFMKQHLTIMVAGHTADFVNSVLQKVANGDRKGGLDCDD